MKKKLKKMPRRRTAEAGKLPENKSTGKGFVRSEGQGFMKSSNTGGKADKGMESYANRRISQLERNRKHNTR